MVITLVVIMIIIIVIMVIMVIMIMVTMLMVIMMMVIMVMFTFHHCIMVIMVMVGGRGRLTRVRSAWNCLLPLSLTIVTKESSVLQALRRLILSGWVMF